MKFFTPDLLARFASEDERVALPAHDELERRSLDYHEHLKGIARKLPARFLEVQERFYLHDARVILPIIPPFQPACLALTQARGAGVVPQSRVGLASPGVSDSATRRAAAGMSRAALPRWFSAPIFTRFA